MNIVLIGEDFMRSATIHILATFLGAYPSRRSLSDSSSQMFCEKRAAVVGDTKYDITIQAMPRVGERVQRRTNQLKVAWKADAFLFLIPNDTSVYSRMLHSSFHYLQPLKKMYSTVPVLILLYTLLAPEDERPAPVSEEVLREHMRTNYPDVKYIIKTCGLKGIQHSHYFDYKFQEESFKGDFRNDVTQSIDDLILEKERIMNELPKIGWMDYFYDLFGLRLIQSQSIAVAPAV